MSQRTIAGRALHLGPSTVLLVEGSRFDSPDALKNVMSRSAAEMHVRNVSATRLSWLQVT
jgi:hypothetical protein